MKALVPEHEDVLNSRDTLADALEGQGRLAEAEAEFRDVFKIEERVFGPKHPKTLESRSRLAKTLMAEGKDMDAEMLTVIKLREKVIGLEHPDTIESCYDFAAGLKRQGKMQKAKEFAQRAAVGARKVLGPDHPSTQKHAKLLHDLETTR